MCWSAEVAGTFAAVEFLVEHGADAARVDRWRGTPLRDAEDGSHAEVVAYLRARGAGGARRRVPGLRRNVSFMSGAARAAVVPPGLGPPASTPLRRYSGSPTRKGLIISPPRRGYRSHDPMDVSMDRSNGSCVVS